MEDLEKKLVQQQSFAAGLVAGAILTTLVFMFAGCRHYQAAKRQAEWRGLLEPSLRPEDHDFTPTGSNYPYQTIKDGERQREVIIQYFKDMGLEPPKEK